MLAIVDGEGDTLIDELTDVAGPCALGCTSGENLVFLTGSYDPCLMVVDGDNDRPLREVSTDYGLRSACTDPGTGKVFFASYVPPGVAVVDGHSGQVLDFILTGREPFELCPDTVNHLVYVAGAGPVPVTVVDSKGDSVVGIGGARLAEWDDEMAPICVDSRDRSVYVAARDDSLAVYDWSCGRLIREIRVGNRVKALVYSYSLNCVYCATDSGIAEIDCGTERVTRSIELDRPVSTLCLGSVINRLYCIAGTDLVTIDCKTGNVIRSTPAPKHSSGLRYNSVNNKVYCGGDCVGVYAGSDGRSLVTLDVGPVDWPEAIAYDSRANTVLCPATRNGDIAFIDGQSDRIMTTLDAGVWGGMVADGSLSLAFVYSGADIAVIRKDSLPAELGVTAAPNPVVGTLVRGKLYYAGYAGSILVNATGRKVLDLHPGANDVSVLAPGVYFVREAQTQAVRKVVITR